MAVGSRFTRGSPGVPNLGRFQLMSCWLLRDIEAAIRVVPFFLVLREAAEATMATPC